MAKLVSLIDGSIGAGKSELVRFLAEHRDPFQEFLSAGKGEELETIPEFYDAEMLKIYYRYMNERPDYNELFEKIQLNGRLARLLKAKHGEGIYIFDRGMLSSIFVFTENSYAEGNLTIQARDRIYDSLKWNIDVLGRREPFTWMEQLVVYLQVKDPQVLFDRQQKRATEGENIPLDYFKRTNDRYEQFYADHQQVYARFGLPTPKLVVVDGSVDFNVEQDYHSRLLERIVGEMRTIFAQSDGGGGR